MLWANKKGFGGPQVYPTPTVLMEGSSRNSADSPLDPLGSRSLPRLVPGAV